MVPTEAERSNVLVRWTARSWSAAGVYLRAATAADSSPPPRTSQALAHSHRSKHPIRSRSPVRSPYLMHSKRRNGAKNRQFVPAAAVSICGTALNELSVPPLIILGIPRYYLAAGVGPCRRTSHPPETGGHRGRHAGTRADSDTNLLRRTYMYSYEE